MFDNYVICDDLPKKYGIGANKNKLVIDWKKTVGMNVDLCYRNDIYNVRIIRYENGILFIDYDGYVYEKGISYRNFLAGKFGGILKLNTKDFKINIGQLFKDDKRDLIITDREYKFNDRGYQRFNEKWYKYTCNKCSYEGWITENNLKAGNGCSACCDNPKVVVKELNSIWAKAPWMMDLGISEKDAKTHTPQSNDKIEVVCPDCGREKKIQIYNIYNYKSISCSCGDGKSYISKYILNVLTQLNINFQTEVKYEWNKYVNPKNNKLTQASIDFVIYHNNREIPIEADGSFHRKDNKMNGMTKEQVQYIDKQRDENCLKYLGEKTIRISDEGDIKENILNSKLAIEFDLNNVDWLKCEEFALKNIIKEVCSYWNNKRDEETITDLAKIYNLSEDAIRKYLKRGIPLGWCKYNPKEEYLKGVKKKGKNAKPIEVFKDGVSLGKYDSMISLSQVSLNEFGVFLNQKSISLVCIGKQKSYKGFIFKYL